MKNKPQSLPMSALQPLYEQLLDIEARFKKLLSKEPEFKEAEKEAKVLEVITNKLK